MTIARQPTNQMWLIQDPSGSCFAVEYGVVKGKVRVISQGFTKGNVVSLLAYRRVREQAYAILGG